MQAERTRIAHSIEAGTAGLDLFPVSIVAIGSAAGPAPRLLGLQSAVAKAFAMLAAVRVPRLRLPRPAWPRLRAQ